MMRVLLMRVLPRGVRPALIAMSVTCWTAAAFACPSCPTARAVRENVYDASFWWNLAVVLLPLSVLVAWCRRLYRIGLEPAPPSAGSGAERRAVDT